MVGKENKTDYYGWVSESERANQRDLFNQILTETKDIEYKGLNKTGPFINDFKAVLKRNYDEIKHIHPDLTPEFLAPVSYRSAEVAERLKLLPTSHKAALEAVEVNKINHLKELAYQVTAPALRSQTIDPGVLDVPPYRKQTEFGVRQDMTRTCFNACMRMVLQDLTNNQIIPDGLALKQALEDTYGNAIVDDEVYLRMLQSSKLEEMSGRSMRAITVTGASFDLIGQVASEAKKRIKGAKCYAIVAVKSESASENVWHTNVLLGVNGYSVFCHDPSTIGKQNKEIDKHTFASRWALALNRVHIIIAK